MEIEKGMIVKSVAGHDKNRFYVVVKIKNNRAYIADGKKRVLELPKAKNFIHLKVTKNIVDLKEFKSNKKLRNLLHRFNY